MRKLKNGSLLPARFLIEKFIANNGGGIANFLYNAWLRDVPYYLPNQKGLMIEYEYNIEELLEYKIDISEKTIEIISNYWGVIGY
jgi:hypothetical protein